MLPATRVAVGVGVAAVLLLVVSKAQARTTGGSSSFGSGFNYGGPDSANGLSRDPDRLLPAFARRLNLLFSALRARGYDPMLNEGYRSPARALALSQPRADGSKPPGIANSLHIYGAAADIISASSGFSNPAFFRALGEEADRLGLFWGGHFKSHLDTPHVQAVPGELDTQLRTLAARGGDINAFAANQLGVPA
jgi:hypothetical protein